MKRFVLITLLILVGFFLSAQTGTGWRYTPKMQNDSLVVYRYFKVGDGWIKIINPVLPGQVLRGVQQGGRVIFTNQSFTSETGEFVEADPIYSASTWFTTTNNAAQWDLAYQAYLWGNHADAGYVTGTPWRNEGYLKSYNETDPSVYPWAKASVKPSYSWNEITGKPTITAQVNSDWNATSGVAMILNKPTLFDGSWNSLTGKPSFSMVALSGSYNDLTDKPVISDGQVNADWNATSGPAMIINKPTIPQAQQPADWAALAGPTMIINKPTLFDGSWSSLSGKPTFATVAATGNYNDLLNKPALFNGSWAALTGKPTFATVSFTGNYNDLLNKPTISDGQVNADWNATSGAAMILNKPTIPAAQVPADWNATSGVTRILNKPTLFNGTWASLTGKPTFATVATSGNYNDLLNKPASQSMPPSGIPYSTGTTWGASIPNNSYNWNLAATNMGKSNISGTSSYGNLSSDYYAYNSGIITPIVSTSPTLNSTLPITSGSVYSALLNKMSSWNLLVNGSSVATVSNNSSVDMVAGPGINLSFSQGHLNISATGIGSETDPTVPSWAKVSPKPSYDYWGAAPTYGSYSNYFQASSYRVGSAGAWDITPNGSILEFRHNGVMKASLGTDGLITSTDYKQSDRRLKSHIRLLRDVAWVDNVHLYSYLFKPDGKYHLGVIAQEVEAEQPDLVTKTSDGMLAVNMTEVLLAKIARLEQQMEKQQKEIKRLKRRCHER